MRISDWSSDVCSSDLDAAATKAEADRLAAIKDAADRKAERTAKAEADRKAAAKKAAEEKVAADKKAAAEKIAAAKKRSEEHTSELQSLMRISYAVFCLKKKKQHTTTTNTNNATILTKNTNTTIH